MTRDGRMMKGKGVGGSSEIARVSQQFGKNAADYELTCRLGVPKRKT